MTVETMSPPLADGQWYAHLRTIDEAGNASDTAHAGPFLIDTTPPSIPASPSSTSHRPGTPSNLGTIAIRWASGQDEPDGSRLVGYSYTWDQSPTAVPGSEASLPANAIGVTDPPLPDGRWYFHLRAVDAAGNASEAAHIGPFLIDTTAPSNPITVTETHGIQDGAWHNQIVAPAFAWAGAVDEMSAIARYGVYWGTDTTGTSTTVIDQARFEAPTATTAADRAATWHLRVSTVDQAGNQAPWETLFSFHYDAAPPTGTLTANNGQPTTRHAAVPLSLLAQDEGSGATAMRFSADGVQWSTWEAYRPTRMWALLPETGAQTIYAQIRDAAGNVSDPLSASVRLEIEQARPSSSSYRLASSVIGSGSGSKTSASYQVNGTHGQTTSLGGASSDSYRVRSGFWATSLGADRQTVQIQLRAGWNLISLPVAPTNSSLSTVLRSAAGSYDQVYAYDGCDVTDPWKQHLLGGPPGDNDLLQINETIGVWLHATAPVTLTVTGKPPATTAIPLCTGWNLVGYPSSTPKPIADALSPIAGSYTRIRTFDATDATDPWKEYNVTAPAYANDLVTLVPGQGYWIYVTTPCTLAVSP